MRKEFTEEDYIESFKYKYRLNGNERLLNLANLNGRVLWHGFQPFEEEQWEKLPGELRDTPVDELFDFMKDNDLLRPLTLVLTNHRNSHP